MEEELKIELAQDIDTKKIEEAIEEKRKVEEAEVEKSLNYDALTAEEKAAIDSFLEKVDVKNTTQVLQFGSSAQNNISKFSDTVLADVKTRSTGEVGDLLSSLVVEIKEFDSSIPVEEKKGILGLFHSVKKDIEKLLTRYNKVEANVATIQKQLENHKLTMMKDIAVFDNMYQQNLDYFKQLSLYLKHSGHLRLVQISIPSGKDFFHSYPHFGHLNSITLGSVIFYPLKISSNTVLQDSAKSGLSNHLSSEISCLGFANSGQIRAILPLP